MNRGEKFIHPHNGEVTLVDICDEDRLKVRLANGTEQIVTASFLSPIVPPPVAEAQAEESPKTE